MALFTVGPTRTTGLPSTWFFLFAVTWVTEEHSVGAAVLGVAAARKALVGAGGARGVSGWGGFVDLRGLFCPGTRPEGRFSGRGSVA